MKHLLIFTYFLFFTLLSYSQEHAYVKFFKKSLKQGKLLPPQNTTNRSVLMDEEPTLGKAYAKKLHNDIAYSLAIHPTQSLVASGSGKDKKVQLFDYEKKEIKHTFSNLQGGVRTLIFSPDGKYLIAGTWSRQLYLWEVETGNKIFQKPMHNKEIKALAISADGEYLATGSSDTQIMIWKMNDLSYVRTLKGHSNKVNDLTFTQDQRFLISVSDDRKVIVWDWQKGTKHKELTAHKGKVTTVQVDEDQKYFLTGGSDKKVIKWDLLTFEKIKEKKLTGIVNIHQLSIDKSATYFLRCGKKYQMELYNYESFDEQQKILISKRGILKCGFSYDNQQIIGVNYNGQIVTVPISLPYPYASVLLEKIQEHPDLKNQSASLQDTLLNLIEIQVKSCLNYLAINSKFPSKQQLEEALYYTEYLQSQKKKTIYTSYQKQLEVYLILVNKETSQYAKALQYFEQKKQENPQELINYFVLSQIYEAQNEKEKHKALLEEALEIQKDWKPALLVLGNDYLKQGKIKEATAYFDKLIKFHSSESIGYQKKGEIAFELGNFVEAEKMLTTALKKDTNNASIYYWLGNLAFERGLYEDSRKYYKKAIKKNPSFLDAEWKLIEQELYLFEHHLRNPEFLYTYSVRTKLAKYPQSYLLAKRFLLLYHYQSLGRLKDEFSRDITGREQFLDSALTYVNQAQGSKAAWLKKEILEAQHKTVSFSIFSDHKELSYRLLQEQYQFTKVHEKELLKSLKKNPYQKEYYVILLKYYHQNNAKKFEKWYQKMNAQFPKSPWVQEEYIRLIGAKDVKKLQSALNAGLKKDKKYSFFYQIKNNLKQEGKKRLSSPKEPQIAYDSVKTFQDYVIYYHNRGVMTYKNLVGEVQSGNKDYSMLYYPWEQNPLDTDKEIHWSDYVQVIQNHHHQYGLVLTIQTPEMEKYNISPRQVKPVVPPNYDTLFLLKNGGVIVEINKKQGLYHLDRGKLLPNIYQKIYLADRHCLFVQTTDNKWGVVDWNGELLVPVEYDQLKKRVVKNISVIEAQKAGKTTYFNYSGEKITPFKKNFTFTKKVKGKLKSMTGYDEYADFADNYSLHKEVSSSSFYHRGNSDSILSVALLGEINQMRLKENLLPFATTKSLYYAANNHARDMVKHQFFAHDSKVWYKKKLEHRIQIEGGLGYGYSEIVYKEPLENGKNYKEYIQKLLKKHLQNSAHRKKLQSSHYRYIACGVSYDRKNKNLYVVYNFAEEVEEKKINPSTFKWTDIMYGDYTYETFALLPEIHRKIDTKNVNYALLNAAIFYETNRQRVLNGKKRYLHSPKLEEAAFVHSKDMVLHKFFSHTSPLAGKESFTDRYDFVGAKCGGYRGENIRASYAVGKYTYHQLAIESLDAWMNSPGHRANILDDAYRFLGCGGYTAKGTDFKATQNFSETDRTYREFTKPKKQKKKKKKKRRK